MCRACGNRSRKAGGTVVRVAGPRILALCGSFHALYRAMQGAIDLGQHLIADRGLPVPSAYREIFRVLGDAGLIEAELSRSLEGWGGMRNVVAHQYGALDIQRVARALYDELDELEGFAAAMARLVPSEHG